MAPGARDVVIVGGGIAGLATAYYLAKDGIKSTVVEQDGIASHASGFAYGGLSGGIPNGPGINSPVMLMGMNLHRQLSRDIWEQTGTDVQYQDRPLVRIALDADDCVKLQADWDWKTSQIGYLTRWLDPIDLRELEPRITPYAIGGIYVEGTTDVEPYRLTLGLAQAAEAMGVTIRSGSVMGLQQQHGQVTGVDIGYEVIKCDTVVLAIGPWSGTIASSWIGSPIGVKPLKGQIVRLRVPGDPYHLSIGHGKNYAMTKPSDGLVWCGTTEEDVGFTEGITIPARDEILDACLTMLPSLEEAEVVMQTACLRPVSSDGAIVLGTAPKLKGAYLCTGAGRQGIVMGPAMGKLTASLITDGATEIPVDPYSASRFL